MYRQQARMSKTCGPVAGTHGDVLTYTRRRFERTHRGVFSSLSSLSPPLSFSSLVLSLFFHVSFSFFLLFSLFSFLLYLLFHLLFLHTQRRDQTDK